MPLCPASSGPWEGQSRLWRGRGREENGGERGREGERERERERERGIMQYSPTCLCQSRVQVVVLMWSKGKA